MLKAAQIIIFLAVTGLIASSYSPHRAMAQDEESIDFEDADFDQDSSSDSADTDFSDEELDTDLADDSGAAPEAQDDDLDIDDSEKVTEEKAPKAEPPADDGVLEPLAEDPPQLSEDIPKSEDMNIVSPPEPEQKSTAEVNPPASDFTSLSADSDSGPDLEYEARLYDIYVRHLSKSTPDEDWNRVVGSRSDQRYRIQRGDTLWDISHTLFGDGNYWPKIWSLNSSITNPHLIKPGNIIRFILGDESGPPAFTVTESEQEESSNTTTTLSQNDEGPEIPPPTKRYNPVVKKLPPSLPAYQDPSASGAGYDDAGIEYGRRKIIDLVDQFPLSAYIEEAPPRALGKVSEVETGFNLASSLQYVYVRMNRGEGEVGASYLSVMDRGAIKADTSVVKQKNLGFGIEVLGEVQLLEKVSSEKKNKEDGEVYRALVTKTVSPVAVGSSLIPGKIEQVNLAEKGDRSQIVAQIIGGQFSNDRKLYNPQSYAYLNKGENDGLRVGQILPIRLNRKGRDNSSQVLANVRVIGWLKIVKTTPKFATAVILRAWEGIATGDFTGAGEMNQAGLENLDQEDDIQTAKGSISDVMDDGAVQDVPTSESGETLDDADGFDDGDFSDDGSDDTTFE